MMLSCPRGRRGPARVEAAFAATRVRRREHVRHRRLERITIRNIAEAGKRAGTRAKRCARSGPGASCTATSCCSW
jgi:hypothetical protein